jgi:hypothetical protein
MPIPLRVCAEIIPSCAEDLCKKIYAKCVSSAPRTQRSFRALTLHGKRRHVWRTGEDPPDASLLPIDAARQPLRPAEGTHLAFGAIGMASVLSTTRTRSWPVSRSVDNSPICGVYRLIQTTLCVGVLLSERQSETLRGTPCVRRACRRVTVRCTVTRSRAMTIAPCAHRALALASGENPRVSPRTALALVGDVDPRKD